MKFPSSLLAIVAFTLAMVWTWNVIHAEAAVAFETHSGIQERLTTLIEDSIKTQKPSASDFSLNKIWTEVIADNKVKVTFAYTYRENGEAGPVTTSIKGEGVLERQPSDGSVFDRWTLTSVVANSDALVFEEGLVVTPDAVEATPQQ